MWRVRWIGIGVLTVPLVLVALVPGPTAEAREPAPSVIRVGLVRSLFRDTSESLVYIVMRPFKGMLETQTGLSGEILTVRNARQLGQQMKDAEVQLGVFQGVEFAWARLKNPKLKPLVIAVNGKRFLHACLVVRGDGKVTEVAHLKGKPVALPRQSREHCRLYLERRCVSGGCAAKDHFARVTTPRDAQDALDDLYEGKVHGAVVEATDLEHYRKEKPRRSSRLKTLQQSEPFPCGVIAYYPGSLSEAQIDRLREGMMTAHETRQGKQFLELCKLTGFEPVPADYNAMLESIAKNYPPPEAEK